MARVWKKKKESEEIQSDAQAMKEPEPMTSEMIPEDSSESEEEAKSESEASEQSKKQGSEDQKALQSHNKFSKFKKSSQGE